MRVALIQEHLDVRRGGAESATIELAQHLAGLGLRVTVITVAGDRTSVAADRSAGVPRSDLPRPAFHFVGVGYGSRAARTARFIARADRCCRRGRFDIVHALVPCLSCNVYQPRGGTYVETVARSVGLARTRPGRLLKRLARRFNRRQRRLLRLEQTLLTRPDPPFVAAVSRYVARQVADAFADYPQQRVRVIFNGVVIDALAGPAAEQARSDLRRQLGLSEAGSLLLFVAHNFKLKGLAELLRALAVLDRERQPRAAGGSATTLAVVGRGAPRRYQRLARRLGVGDRLRFLGPRRDLPALYAAADLLVHPTWYDPCSRVVLEALCCGLPVVTTRCNGAAEVMVADRHGMVVDRPDEAAALAAAIRDSLRPELRAACRADAPRLRRQLSMARHAAELKTLYEEIVAG